MDSIKPVPKSEDLDSSRLVYKGDLQIWGKSVLVAKQSPLLSSAKPFQSLGQARSCLSAEFETEFGVKPFVEYTPHVSLGYFANQTLAQLAISDLGRWNEQVRHTMTQQQIEFHHVSCYGFTDMATFFPLARILPSNH